MNLSIGSLWIGIAMANEIGFEGHIAMAEAMTSET
jgi:hypothetical protein